MWQQYPDRGWGWHGDWMWWMPFHGIMWVIFIAAVVVGLVLLVRLIWHGGARPSLPSQRSSALDALDARYAKGEIDRDDYLQRKRDLTGS